jgi:hypothetical protein
MKSLFLYGRAKEKAIPIWMAFVMRILQLVPLLAWFQQ